MRMSRSVGGGNSRELRCATATVTRPQMSLNVQASDLIPSLLAALLIAAVHVSAGHLGLRSRGERSRLLSAAAGSSMGYVFVYVLPKLSRAQGVLLATDHPGLLGYLEHHAYLVALAGFLLYYGVDLAAANTRADARRWLGGRACAAQALGFAAYSALVGYLIASSKSWGALVAVTIAMALHFLAADHGLHHKFAELFDRRVRWLLGASVLFGWALGRAWRVAPETEALWFSFLAGAIIINAIWEELPQHGESHYRAFIGGAVAYAAVALAVEAAY